MKRAQDNELVRGGASLALGLFLAALLAEGRFRVLQAQQWTLLESDPAAGAEGAREAVAAWIVAGGIGTAWINALVLGGVLAGTSVAVHRRSFGQRALLTLLFGVLATLVLAGLGVVGTEFLLPSWSALEDSGLHPLALAGLCLTGSLLAFWLGAPLAARAGRSRASWIFAALAIALSGVHATSLFLRGDAPLHPVQEQLDWFVTSGAQPLVTGAVTLESFGALHVAAGARMDAALPAGARFAAWIESTQASMETQELPSGSDPSSPYRLIDARLVETAQATSRRSSTAAPSLLSIAVDGLRGADLEALLRSGSAPAPVQRLAEAGVLFTDVIAPTSDPRVAEAALLAGAHPAASGRAPLPRHLGALLNRAGFRSQLISSGAPRPGVVGGFAAQEPHTGVAAIERARRFLALHGEERFHLHVTLEQLSVEALWADAAGVPGSPRPAGLPTLDALRGAVLQRELERTTRASRHDDEPPIDVDVRAWLDAAHRARTRRLLAEVGTLFADIEALGLAQRTLVVLVGTSGIALGEHGKLGFGQDLYAKSVRVPLLARGPQLPVGEIRTGERSLIDVAAGLARSLHVPWPGSARTWAWSAAEISAQPLFLRLERGSWNGITDREILGLRDDGFAYLWCPAAEDDSALLPGFGPWRLFRTEDDAREANDLALVSRFRLDALELRAAIEVLAAEHLTLRTRAESALEAWRASGAFDQVVRVPNAADPASDREGNR